MAAPKTFRFVVAEQVLPAAVDRLREYGTVLELTDASPVGLRAALQDADAIVTKSRTHLTARVLEAAPQLKVVGRISPACDYIDQHVIRERRIQVVYAPDSASRSLIEYTVALILAAHRRIPYFEKRLRAGEYASLRNMLCGGLSRTVVGLLGVNEVGEGVGSILRSGFGARVIYHDPTGARPLSLEAEEVDFETLLKTSGILSLHLPQRPSTQRILNAERIAMLSPSCIVVNASRGTLIDTPALAEALKTGAIAGAAIDVFEHEPLPLQHPLRTAPNCILTPHMGPQTRDSEEAAFDVVEDVLRVLRGEAPKHPYVPDPDAPLKPTST